MIDDQEHPGRSGVTPGGLTSTWFGVDARASGELLVERHCYAPGPAAETPRHSHAEYQCCLSVDCPGEYEYREARHAVPIGALSVLHPDTAHVARDLHHRRRPATWRLVYVPAVDMARVAADAGRGSAGPSFREPVLAQPSLASEFARAHAAGRLGATALTEDVLWERFLARLALEHSSPSGTVACAPRGGDREADQARDYLQNHWAEAVRLRDLGAMVGLSPQRLCSVFGRRVGVPPHRFQLQLRVDRAKSLLVRGVPIADVARTTGFVDQSHLSRHFKRFVGVAPGAHLGRRCICGSMRSKSACANVCRC